MKFSFPPRHLMRAVGAAVLSAAVLVGCGGSTSQVDSFTPTRLIVLGDELSALIDTDNNGNGYNYAMNALDSSDTTNRTVSCSTDPIWVQRLASYYGLVFSECNPNSLQSSELNAYMLAAYGATVSAVEEQYSTFQATVTHSSLNSGDLVTIWAGLHDIVEIYEDNSSLTTMDLKKAEAKSRGERIAAVANAIMDTGAKVLVAEVMDVGDTPWGRNEGSTSDLNAISEAFNEGLLNKLNNDGTKVGLLAFNDTIATITGSSSYEQDELACSSKYRETVSTTDKDGDNYVDGGTNLAACTTATTTSDTASSNDVWADSLQLNSRIASSKLYNLAIYRATNNPF